ncbi:MAG TPA: hypothetical protein VNU26_09840 [Mycobacteriales bacterium]|nr:hypothetical protein [Mycobacteriales bacterium]
MLAPQLLLVPGSQLVVYPVLWVLMPNDERPAWSGAVRPTG